MPGSPIAIGAAAFGQAGMATPIDQPYGGQQDYMGAPPEMKYGGSGAFGVNGPQAPQSTAASYQSLLGQYTGMYQSTLNQAAGTSQGSAGGPGGQSATAGAPPAASPMGSDAAINQILSSGASGGKWGSMVGGGAPAGLATPGGASAGGQGVVGLDKQAQTTAQTNEDRLAAFKKQMTAYNQQQGWNPQGISGLGGNFTTQGVDPNDWQVDPQTGAIFLQTG
jgi:hypothetical protein